MQKPHADGFRKLFLKKVYQRLHDGGKPWYNGVSEGRSKKGKQADGKSRAGDTPKGTMPKEHGRQFDEPLGLSLLTQVIHDARNNK